TRGIACRRLIADVPGNRGVRFADYRGTILLRAREDHRLIDRRHRDGHRRGSASATACYECSQSYSDSPLTRSHPRPPKSPATFAGPARLVSTRSCAVSPLPPLNVRAIVKWNVLRG